MLLKNRILYRYMNRTFTNLKEKDMLLRNVRF